MCCVLFCFLIPGLYFFWYVSLCLVCLFRLVVLCCAVFFFFFVFCLFCQDMLSSGIPTIVITGTGRGDGSEVSNALYEGVARRVARCFDIVSFQAMF